MLRILTQEVEPDYLRAHVRSGLGFRSRTLCKAETEAKKVADSLSLAEGDQRITGIEDREVI